MTFRVLGLEPAPFAHLFGMEDSALQAFGARRFNVDKAPGFPDRIEVRDAVPGQSVILLNYVHQPADTPYRASHAIFVREFAERRCDSVGELPQALRIRPISLRAFDESGNMLDADLADGAELAPIIARFLARPAVSYLHAHYAKRGCYAARIERA